MLFGREKTVHVTTKAELDSALGSANRIVVEGDDALLSYAVQRASSNPANKVDVELPDAEVTIQPRLPKGDTLVSTEFDELRHRERPLPHVAKPAPPSRPWLLRAVVVLVFFAILWFVGFWGYLSSHSPIPASSPPDLSQPLPPPQSSGGGLANALQTIVWPAVALAAILALYLITRQAISSGQNVEIAWKVTEKVSGRVVITRVPAKKGRATQA